jgi:hypothetical protein
MVISGMTELMAEEHPGKLPRIWGNLQPLNLKCLKTDFSIKVPSQ